MLKSLIDRIEQEYGGISVDLITSSNLGISTENYHLESGKGSYFLKRFNTDKKRLDFIQDAEQQFSNFGIPVLLPITSNSGKKYCEFENGLYVLFPYIRSLNGEQISNTDRAFESMVRMMINLHDISKNFPKHSHETFPIRSRGMAREAIETLDEKLHDGVSHSVNLIRDTLSLKRECIDSYFFETRGVNGLQFSLIHGDLTIRNMLFTESGDLLKVIDFERVGYGLPEVELFRSLFLSLNYKDSSSDLLQFQHYVKSYLKESSMDFARVLLGFRYCTALIFRDTWLEEQSINGNLRAVSLLELNHRRLSFIKKYFLDMESILLNIL